MATSSIPGAIDHLVTWARAASQFAAPVVVCDGLPDAEAALGIAFGVTPGGDDTNANNFHAELGAQAQWEEYDIPCLIWSFQGGGAEVMKTARDNAFTLLNALDTYLRTTTGRTLAGVLSSGHAIITPVSIRQTDLPEQAGEGRVCELVFSIHCKSRSAA